MISLYLYPFYLLLVHHQNKGTILTLTSECHRFCIAICHQILPTSKDVFVKRRIFKQYPHQSALQHTKVFNLGPFQSFSYSCFVPLTTQMP